MPDADTANQDNTKPYQYSFSAQEMLQINIKSFTGFVAFLVGLLLVFITGYEKTFSGHSFVPRVEGAGVPSLYSKNRE